VLKCRSFTSNNPPRHALNIFASGNSPNRNQSSIAGSPAHNALALSLAQQSITLIVRVCAWMEYNMSPYFLPCGCKLHRQTLYIAGQCGQCVTRGPREHSFSCCVRRPNDGVWRRQRQCRGAIHYHPVSGACTCEMLAAPTFCIALSNGQCWAHTIMFVRRGCPCF
jgi:hypothetical protein